MRWVFLLWLLPVQLAPVPAGEAILKRVEAALASVHDYTVSLEVTADLEQARIPPMKATMYFKQPDRVHFESEGFALLPREAFGLSPARLLERFRVDSVVAGGAGEEREYRLRLTPRDEKTRVQEMWVQVSSVRWTIDGGEISLPEGRVMALRFRHEQVGGVWLPSELSLTFSGPGGAIAEPSLPDEQKPFRFGRNAPRQGSVAIRFTGYRLNTGLSDDIFTRSSAPGAH